MLSRLSSLLVPAVLCLVLCTIEGLSLEQWSSCQGSCTSLLSNRSCPIENGTCRCQWANESSFCKPVDQRLLTNLTGPWQENTTDCCYCKTSQKYCCQKCNSTLQKPTSATSTTANPLTSEYFRLLILFVLDCTKYMSQTHSNFTKSFSSAMSQVMNVNPAFIKVHNRSCLTGKSPYCGLDVEEIRAHHRARRLAAGGRSRGGGGSNKKTDDDKNDKNYSNKKNNQWTMDRSCKSLAVNCTVYAGKETLASLRELVKNGSLRVSMWNGDISSFLLLSAMNGASYELHKAATSPPPTEQAIEIPPLVTDLKPMIYACGATIFFLCLFLMYRCIKHSVLLKLNRFTEINSDKIEPKKLEPLPEIDKSESEEEEEEEEVEEAKPEVRLGPSYDMTHSSIPYGNNDAIRRYDWTSPAYLPNMLAPVLRSTEQAGRPSTPKLILDDCETEDERQSSDSLSDVNVDEDEIFSDGLSSDDEISKVKVQTPRSPSSLYTKPITPAPSTRQGGASSLEIGRPSTTGDKRPTSVQSRKSVTSSPNIKQPADTAEEALKLSATTNVMDDQLPNKRPASVQSIYRKVSPIPPVEPRDTKGTLN